MNLIEEIQKLKVEGFSEENAQAKLAQDIILQCISRSLFNRKVTVKGGVVMRSISNNVRRATQDIDIDFIRYSLDDNSIDTFINVINNDSKINIVRIGQIEELKHQDYKGKRVYVKIVDKQENKISSKIDIGVHKDLDIEQDEYCFDICYSDECARLLINTPAQMMAEKLKSILRFGINSTRYKDIFDIFYLCEKVNKTQLNKCINKYIYSDNTISINNINDVIKVINDVFSNDVFKRRIQASNKNWLDVEIDDVYLKIITFLKSL